MNILILSCGTRNKIVRYFKKTLSNAGNVIAADMSRIAPALYEADRYYIVPCITDAGYIDEILDICQKERINGVISLIDPELSLLAKHADRFEAVGATFVGSSYELCERCLNKYEMYKWLEGHGYKCAKSFIDFSEFLKSRIGFPVFIKPVNGSASTGVAKAADEKTAEFLFDQRDGMMVQEFLDGQEIGADVYVDMISGEAVSIFTKKKLIMRSGETDKAVSFKDSKLFDLIEKYVKESGFKGQIDIDIFEVNGDYYISEVNPRFGGGYPHAYECGCDHIKMIMENLSGRINERKIGCYDDGIVMMKYNDVMIKRI